MDEGRKNDKLDTASQKIAFLNQDKEKLVAQLIALRKELDFQNNEKGKRAEELRIANIELAFENLEKEKRAEELRIVNVELTFQNVEKENRALELVIANKELAFQNEEKHKRAEELIIANKELAFLNTEQQRLFAAIVNSSDDAMLSKSLDGIITSWNEGARKIFGYDHEEIIGKHVSILIPTKFQSEEVEILKKIKKGETIGHYQTKRVRKDGTLFDASVSISPILNFNGEIVGASKILRDISAQKQVQLDLKRSDENQKTILHSLLDNVIILNSSSEIVYINHVSSGLREEDVIGSNWLLWLDEQDRLIAQDAFSQTRITGKFTEIQIKAIGAERQMSWFNVKIVRMPDLALQQVLLIATDITEKKESSLEMERTNSLLKLLSESTSDMIALQNPAGEYVYVSPSSESMFGYAATELIGRTPYDFMHLDDIERVMKAINENTLKEEINQFFEYRLKSKNGKYIWVESNFTPIYDLTYREIVKIQSTSRNITTRKSSEEAVDLLTNRLLLATRSAKLGIWDWNLENNILVWDKNMHIIYDVSTNGFTGNFEAWKEKVHPDDLLRVQAEIQESIMENKDFNSSFRICCRNNKIRYIEGYANIERDTAGKAVRMVGVNRDITEQKAVEETKKKLTNDIIKRNQDLEQFTFIISHNLRAPNANIIGLAEMLQDKSLSPQEQKKFLRGISASARQLDETIKDINSIVQVKVEVSENKELISFSKLVDDILITVGNLVTKHHVKIKTNFEDVDEFFSLKLYVYSIFYNLISNSIKFRKSEEQPIIEINSKKDNEKIILTFKDNGIGIDMKTHGKKVFGLYKRFHPRLEGKGMGLFMVKTQVEALGGEITVTSELDKGTQFTIIFKNKINL